MGHPLRCDAPGALFHVVNRGLARRSIVEHEREARFFMSLMARGVRKGWLRVHAYALMTNHYHLLVTSEGGLSQFVQWGMSRFVRCFNRGRERDGPLFRGRFKARRVHGEQDLKNVVRYIDRNPVEAGMVESPFAYLAGSARHYAALGRRPLWLDRALLEQFVQEAAGTHRYDPTDYVRLFHRADDAARWCVERNLERHLAPGPGIFGLSREAPTAALLEWLRHEAAADGWTRRGPLIAPCAVRAALARLRAGSHQPEGSPRDGRASDVHEILACGLLRVGCGLTTREVAAHLGLSPTAARLRCRRHAQLIKTSASYGRLASEVLAAGLREIA
jgi:REP element-mobilizing transposase RayT